MTTNKQQLIDALAAATSKTVTRGAKRKYTADETAQRATARARAAYDAMVALKLLHPEEHDALYRLALTARLAASGMKP